MSDAPQRTPEPQTPADWRRALDALPTWFKTAGLIGAVFSGGMIAQEKWRVMEQGPQDISAIREDLAAQSAQLAAIRADLALTTANALRISYMEDAICTDAAIGRIGPDRDRRCYAMLRGRSPLSPRASRPGAAPSSP